jgi:hypothetical protein
MVGSDEFEKGWFASLAIGIAENELRNKRFVGRFGRARKKVLEDTIRRNSNYLTPPAKRRAIVWHRLVLELVSRTQGKRKLSLTRLVSNVITLAAKERLPLPVGELQIRRYLNSVGYRDNPGRWKMFHGVKEIDALSGVRK